MAIGVVRGYRTISHEAACVLAGSPPWEIEAEFLASMYDWRSELRHRGQRPSPRECQLRKSHTQQLVFEKWKERLAHPKAGSRTVEAVRPILPDWTNRRHGSLTFRLVQVLSGHGCFGKYLCRIAGREPTTECHHCGSDEDTAQHTLEDCPAWAELRRDLVVVVGDDLSLPALIKAMVGCERAWSAGVIFCEQVMSRKEAAERERERTTDIPIRSRRVGRRRRAYQAFFHPP